jgi:hypothetical protein
MAIVDGFPSRVLQNVSDCRFEDYLGIERYHEIVSRNDELIHYHHYWAFPISKIMHHLQFE